MTQRLPWAALMAAGLGRLRLAPESFWAMSPREFQAALGETVPMAPLGRDGLTALMARHPDERNSDDRG